MTTTARQLRNPEVAQIVARKFFKGNAYLGMEYEEFEQEAYAALWLSETDGFYDPHKSSLKTFSTTCVSRALLTVIDVHKRKHPLTEEVSEWLADGQPDPEEAAIFREMLSQLPDDARHVVALVLEETYSLTTPTSVKRAISESLGWTSDRIKRAFSAIEVMLGAPDELDRLLDRLVVE